MIYNSVHFAFLFLVHSHPWWGCSEGHGLGGCLMWCRLLSWDLGCIHSSTLPDLGWWSPIALRLLILICLRFERCLLCFLVAAAVWEQTSSTALRPADHLAVLTLGKPELLRDETRDAQSNPRRWSRFSMAGIFMGLLLPADSSGHRAKKAEKSSPSLTRCDPALGCARGCDGGDASRLLLDNSGIDQEPFRGR